MATGGVVNGVRVYTRSPGCGCDDHTRRHLLAMFCIPVQFRLEIYLRRKFAHNTERSTLECIVKSGGMMVVVVAMCGLLACRGLGRIPLRRPRGLHS